MTTNGFLNLLKDSANNSQLPSSIIRYDIQKKELSFESSESSSKTNPFSKQELNNISKTVFKEISNPSNDWHLKDKDVAYGLLKKTETAFKKHILEETGWKCNHFLFKKIISFFTLISTYGTRRSFHKKLEAFRLHAVNEIHTDWILKALLQPLKKDLSKINLNKIKKSHIKKWIKESELKKNSPVALCARKGNLPALKYFLSKGADINGIDCVKNTALHYADYNNSTLAEMCNDGPSDKNQKEMLVYLINSHANLSAKNISDQVPGFYGSLTEILNEKERLQAPS